VFRDTNAIPFATALGVLFRSIIVDNTKAIAIPKPNGFRPIEELWLKHEKTLRPM
jgi:hypothetical protein